MRSNLELCFRTKGSKEFSDLGKRSAPLEAMLDPTIDLALPLAARSGSGDSTSAVEFFKAAVLRASSGDSDGEIGATDRIYGSLPPTDDVERVPSVGGFPHHDWQPSSRAKFVWPPPPAQAGDNAPLDFGIGDLNFDLDLSDNDSLPSLGDLSDIEDIIGTFKENLHEINAIPKTLFWTLTTLYSVFIVLGFLGNCLILWAVLGRESMRTARNVFIVTLAISDLVLCLFTMPSTLWEVRNSLYYLVSI